MTRKTSSVKKRVLKREPGRTFWRGAMKVAMRVMKGMKKTLSTLKKPAAATKKAPIAGTERDKRSNGRWLWMAVTVGLGTERHTHDAGTKRVTFKLLPRKDVAPHKKPRGLVSMKTTIKAHIKRGSFLIFDGWKSSKSAAVQLGYRHAPQ
jgi:hypothetical protein